MATLIDISKLERNEATVPFHIAAGISIWDDPQALSENEALLSSIHTARPETDIQDITAGRNFLSSLEPDQSQSIQRRANNMFGVARLLTEGSTERLPGRDWKPESVEILPVAYREAYYKNPRLSYNDLKSQVIAGENESRTRQFQRETSQQIDEVVSRKISDATTPAVSSSMGALVGLVFAGVTAVLGAPVVVFGGIGIGFFALMTGIGVAIGGIDSLKEIRIPFFS